MPRSRLGRLRRILKRYERLRHRKTLAEWAGLLAQAWPEKYRDPPPPPEATCVMSRQARARVLCARAHAGFALWHHDDKNPAELSTRLFLRPLLGNNWKLTGTAVEWRGRVASGEKERKRYDDSENDARRNVAA